MTIIEAWEKLDEITTAAEARRYDIDLECDKIGLVCSDADFEELVFAVQDKADELEAEENGEFTRPTKEDIDEMLGDYLYEKRRDEMLF